MAEHEDPNEPVPHCEFVSTQHGFRTSFTHWKRMTGTRRLVLWLIYLAAISVALFAGLLTSTLLPGPNGVLLGWSVAVAAFLGSGFCGYSFARTKTVIEVTEDTVIISGKRLQRGDFGRFCIGFRNLFGRGILDYTYAGQTFPVGGLWKVRKATEFADAFNARLHGRRQ